MTTLSDFKETVRQQADIVRIIGDYIQLKKAGAQNFTGLCPFHGEKTPSFSVHATRQFFHCFGCGKSGDSGSDTARRGEVWHSAAQDAVQL
jgi:DNA primase